MATIEPKQRLHAERLARAALELYSLRDAEVELLRYGFRQVFRVRSGSRGEFALRLYDLPEAIRRTGPQPPAADPRRHLGVALRSPGVLRSQLLWLSALRRDTGLLVPKPVPTLGGELVGEVALRSAFWRAPWRRRSTLVKWVPGASKGENLTESDLLRAGSFLATMHDHAEGYAAPEGSEFPRWDWHWAFGETAPLWSEGPGFYSEREMETFRHAGRLVRERLGEIGEEREAFGLVHRDFNLSNVVFSGEGVGVIDFDMCGCGHYLFDLKVARSSLRRRYDDQMGPMWEAFLEGYRRERPLPEGHLATFDAMQRVAAVNRNLALLASETPKHEARGRRFLRDSVTWLRDTYLKGES
jgi:Ser/Thr protein kinase RdoA (MazF antagonist)